MKDSKKNILMIVHNEIETDGRVQRVAETLANRYNVTLFCFRPDNEIIKEKDKYSHKTVEIKRIPKAYFPQVQYFLNWLNFIFYAIKNKPDIIYAHVHKTSLGGYLTSKMNLVDAKFIYDSHELIVKNTKEKDAEDEDLYYWDDRWYKHEKFVIKRSNLNIAPNEERAKIMKEHYDLNRTPLVIENKSRKKVYENFKVKIKDKYPDIDKIKGVKVIYQGSNLLMRNIDDFVKSMKFLPPEFKLLIVGGSKNDQRELKKIIKNNNLLDRVTCLDKVPRSHLYGIMGTCDIGIVSYPFRGLNNYYCASNKIYECAQAGLPVVTTAQPPLKRIIEKYQIGVTISKKEKTKNNGLNPRDISKAIKELKNDYEKKKANLEHFIEENSWENEEKEKLINAVSTL